MNRKVSDWFGFFAPRFLCLTLALGFIIRIILIFHPLTVVDWGLTDWIKIFVLGFLNDVAFTAIALVPAFIAYTLLTDDKYKQPFGYIFTALFTLLTLYVVFFNDITDEYGGPLPRIVNAVLILLDLCLIIKMFIPSVRKAWRTVAVYAIIMIYLLCAVTIAFSEVVFWSEFGVRFNFIAVDYLVYTNEVIGNIMESYPMGLLIAVMLVISGFICYLMVRGKDIRQSGVQSWKRWSLTLVSLALTCVVSFFFLHYGYRHFGGGNLFATQIQENGCWDFLEAFVSNELDYERFYPMLPEEEATALQQELCGMEGGVREIRPESEPTLKNIVLITIESLSASFLTRYGSTDGITPNLDTLLEKSLVFDNLFATGNRTVRGLEAITLCIPPSSGESLVKREDCSGFFSVGDVLRGLGYSTKFIYGGDSYFDNMGAFYGACGYEIVDKKSYDPSAIVFSNIWGTSDEDTYREALARFDEDYASGKRFFAQIMTISNHRPYTYPEGRIQFDGNPMSRAAAVKYTDFAIGDFLSKASAKDWFDDTIFVIVADHCASSAGKTSLPLECYHIPAIVYCPSLVEPAYVGKVCSQIDIMPTLFALMNISYDSKFFGDNILSPDFKERAFMATYQDLGYYSGSVMTVMSPVRKVQQFSISSPSPWEWEENPAEGVIDETNLKEAEAYYQVANISKGRL